MTLGAVPAADQETDHCETNSGNQQAIKQVSKRVEPAFAEGIVLFAIVGIPLAVPHDIFGGDHAPKEVACAFGKACELTRVHPLPIGVMLMIG